MIFFNYAEKEDIRYMYDRANANGKFALRVYHEQFPNRLLSYHRIFQRLHRQICKISSVHVTKHEPSWRRAVRIHALKKAS